MIDSIHPKEDDFMILVHDFGDGDYASGYVGRLDQYDGDDYSVRWQYVKDLHCWIFIAKYL